MKKIFFIVLAAFVFFSAAAWAEDVITVRAEGVAARTDDRTDLKKKALDQALRRSVVEALGIVLKAESMDGTDAMTAAVASNPMAYVINYRITAEGLVNHMELAPPLPDNLPDNLPAGGIELYHIWTEASIDAQGLRGAIAKAISQKGQTSSTRIQVLDITDYGAYRQLLSVLRRVTLIKDLSYGSFYRGRIELVASATADQQALLERIAREASDNFIVAPGAPGTIIIRPAGEASVR